jgi:hypothetical protein
MVKNPCMDSNHSYNSNLRSRVVKWISVKDRLPEPKQGGDYYLCFDKDGDKTIFWYEDGWEYHHVTNPYGVLVGKPLFEITHWASLPEDPEEL